VAEVRVLEPVETEGLTTKDVPRLREQVRAMIEEARAGLRAGTSRAEPDLPAERTA
jgi:hypothetical protein